MCSTQAVVSTFNTHNKFDMAYHEDELSPIDLFIKNTSELNLIKTKNYKPIIGNLLLLGYVSAVESYLRALIRKLIVNDKHIQSIVAEKNVSYAAAYHHTKELLPEALLEDFSLASPRNIFETLKDIVGMKGQKAEVLTITSKEFMKICELRHCCVHRFGKLGSKNATKLGFTDHSKALEKPINLSENDLEEVALIVINFVKVINNQIYKFIMDRTAKNRNGEKNGEKFYTEDWLWMYQKDRKRFKKYYDIFQTSLDTNVTMDMKVAYYLFKKEYNVAAKHKGKSQVNSS